LPAVGVSFGVDVVAEAVREKKEVKQAGQCRVFVVPVKNPVECLPFLQALRRAGVPAAIDLMERSVPRNLEYAAKQGIPFAAIIGEKELAAKKINLRDLATGEEKLVSVEEATRQLSAARQLS